MANSYTPPLVLSDDARTKAELRDQELLSTIFPQAKEEEGYLNRETCKAQIGLKAAVRTDPMLRGELIGLGGQYVITPRRGPYEVLAKGESTRKALLGLPAHFPLDQIFLDRASSLLYEADHGGINTVMETSPESRSSFK